MQIKKEKAITLGYQAAINGMDRIPLNDDNLSIIKQGLNQEDRIKLHYAWVKGYDVAKREYSL